MSVIPSFFRTRRGSCCDPLSLDVWNLPREFQFPQLSQENSALLNTHVDWKETPVAYVFKVDLPGLKKEEVKVQVEDDRVLHISGERNVEEEERNDARHRVERSKGKFMRRFQLPENAKMDQVKASLENGVLTVTIPKEEMKKAVMKSIEISD
ncbi:17.5 kDa class I heat shock protein-like [Diospyros lotus]|uniref:17.5 kDa class I heat shock protein-like n=1 Tax=Diospyros lotus TaxID=55363 RepID=UPI00225B99E2|nr:17.5 kDa class I heat shock protein-like [Diospyros lotus]